MHTYIPTYIHTHIHTYHTYIHKYNTCIRTYIHTYIHTCMHAYIHPCPCLMLPSPAGKHAAIFYRTANKWRSPYAAPSGRAGRVKNLAVIGMKHARALPYARRAMARSEGHLPKTKQRSKEREVRAQERKSCQHVSPNFKVAPTAAAAQGSSFGKGCAHSGVCLEREG